VHCSRREAEQYIQGGWVRVDGKVVEEPQFRVLAHAVELDPQAQLAPVEGVTLLLHQPAGADPGVEIGADPLQWVSAATHATDDGSGIRTLQRHFSRLTATLPLQPGASGLLVLTQDRRVARKLTEDAARIEQEYVVEVSGNLGPDGPPDVIRRLNHGLSVNGSALPSVKVSWQNETRLRFAAKNPRPGQLAHLCENVGLGVLGMKRIRIGRVPMAGLQPGQWRYLAAHERF